MARQDPNTVKMPHGFFVVTAEKSAVRAAAMLATFDDLFNGVRGPLDRDPTAGLDISEQKQDLFQGPYTVEGSAAPEDMVEQESTVLEEASGLVVEAQATDARSPHSQTAAEFAQIRAFVTDVHGILRRTDAAHLAAAPIEHIRRSLDRIEESVGQLVDRRRPGRAAYSNPHLVGLLRDPGSVETGAGDEPSDVEAQGPSAGPLSQAGREMAAVVSGLIPQDADASFVAGMEDVLEVYQRPRDPAYPVVCVDETSTQLLGETRVPIAAEPGQPTRLDDEYERHGTVNLFMMFAPLEDWRHVKVTDYHGALDYAQVLKDLSDTHFPDAKKIILVQDDLSTHKPASLYEAFPAAEARRLVERFEWHNAPKDGSWLDMAKSELGALSSQCLDRRIPDKQTLIKEVAAWKDSRDKNHAEAGWLLTTAEARVRLKRLYPQRDRVKDLT
jgi:hypothetical protein